jgi:hypothetical protein
MGARSLPASQRISRILAVSKQSYSNLQGVQWEESGTLSAEWRSSFQASFFGAAGVTGFLRIGIDYDPRLNVRYSVRNPGTLSQQQFAVLEKHFEKLNLSDRYARQASTLLARLIREFKHPSNLAMGQGMVRPRLTQMAKDRAATLPPDHWETVLLQALAVDDEFTHHIFD